LNDAAHELRFVEDEAMIDMEDLVGPEWAECTA
jgi:hypothetical protein